MPFIFSDMDYPLTNRKPEYIRLKGLFLSEKMKVEEMITENYDIQFKIIEEKSAYIAGNNEIDMFGYFCIRRG